MCRRNRHFYRNENGLGEQFGYKDTKGLVQELSLQLGSAERRAYLSRQGLDTTPKTGEVSLRAIITLPQREPVRSTILQFLRPAGNDLSPIHGSVDPTIRGSVASVQLEPGAPPLHTLRLTVCPIPNSHIGPLSTRWCYRARLVSLSRRI